MLKSTYHIPALPPADNLETVPVLKAAAEAHRYLAEVKGRAASIPNQGILIDTLALQEAKASSEIENIVTTHDELFQATLFPDGPDSGPAKEVERYRDALKLGFSSMVNAQGLITNNAIIAMFQLLKRHDGGFRNTPGTTLKNDRTGDIVYVPPQTQDDIATHMAALEAFINEDDTTIDPLIKMAIIHHQFESIHPFPDGNGRLGRILNVLYLTKTGLLDIPILYLSRSINNSKAEYYRLLQHVRDTSDWEPWLIYMLGAVAETSRHTLSLLEGIRQLMADYKRVIRSEHGKIYSQDLLNNLFRHPYTRIEFLQSDLSISRQTASKYLDQLASGGLLEMHRSGTSKYYINVPLVALLSELRPPQS